MATAGGKLTAVAIKAASVGKLSDGGGLFLDVRANVSRYWRMKYRHAGKERLLASYSHSEAAPQLPRYQKPKTFGQRSMQGSWGATAGTQLELRVWSRGCDCEPMGSRPRWLA